MAVSKLKNKTRDDIIRICAMTECELFCVFSFFFFAIAEKDNGKAVMSFLSILYVMIPNIVQKLFKFRVDTTLYIFILIYAICPLLGYSYKLYYKLAWWDDLLHAFAGVIFAMFGAYLPKILNKEGDNSIALCAVVGLAVSIAIAALWEFAEFGMDNLYGTDMQKDTLIHTIRSYLLGEELGLPKGELGIAEVITSTTINETTLQGYIDIGLIDTMKDMFVETLGAALYIALFVGGKGKRFVFERVLDTETEETQPTTSFIPTLSPQSDDDAEAETHETDESPEGSGASRKE
jgi:uncharacterized membrane protein YjdF